MASKTSIEWTDATWNPATGCTKVSPGCDNCYAETFAERWRGSRGHYFENGFDVQLRPDKLEVPLRWRRPRRIFVNSMSDLFHADVPDAYIAKVFGVMALTPRHTYQVLTKRHARMRSLLNNEAFHLSVLAETARQQDEKHPMPAWNPGPRRLKAWPLPNVWLGVSVENQQWADIRIPALLETPAAVRFLSCEPLLGPVDLWGPIEGHRGRPRLTYWLDGRPGWGPDQTTDTGLVYQELETGPRIGWVIVGGESGPGARPMDIEWARTLRDQCAHSGVPFLFKQTGSVLARELGIPGKGTDFDLLPADLQIREYPHA